MKTRTNFHDYARLAFDKKTISDERFLFCGLLVVFCAACYMQVLNFGFLIIDDPIYVTNNPQVRQGLKLETVKWAFSSFEAEFWHPLTWLSLMLDSTLYNFLPRGFHSTSLLLHLAASIFLFLSFDIMTGQRNRSFVLASLFAVHPLHVESVAWIAERKEVLCGFFWCAALFAYSLYVRTPCPTRYLAVLALFCLGLMSKPMIVTFPFLLLLLDFWPLKRHVSNAAGHSDKDVSDKRKLVALLVEKLPFFAATGVAVGLAFYAQNAGQGIVGSDIYPFKARVANAILSYKTYLFKTVYPADLSIFYPFRMDMPAVKVAVAAVGLLFLTGAAILRIKKQPYLFTGWFWFLGTLVPVIGIVKIGDFAMADRYMYMPIVGILVALIWLGADLLNRPLISKAFPALLSVGVVMIGATVTWQYLGHWKNSETLFQHAATAAEPNYFAHYALGHIYAGKGNYIQAEQHFYTAATLRTDKLKIRIEFGRAIGSQGRFDDAITHFKTVLMKKEENAEANFYMGLALAGAGKISNALDHFAKAIKSKYPDSKRKNSDLHLRLEMLRIDGKVRQALELLGIKSSNDSIKKMFVNGYNSWRI